jgi:hypothetical protein
VRPRQLRAEPAESRRLPANSIPGHLERAVDTPDGMRLEFAGGLHVDVPNEAYYQTKDWIIEFPTRGMRIL